VPEKSIKQEQSLFFHYFPHFARFAKTSHSSLSPKQRYPHNSIALKGRDILAQGNALG